MFCKMDVDDEYRTINNYRCMGCSCKALPRPAIKGSGCSCTECGVHCRECIGFGYTQLPSKRFHLILSQIQTRIKRSMRIKGKPPGFIRLQTQELSILIGKAKAESVDHWIHRYVDLGPPVRIFDVLIVRDRRRF